MMLPSQHHQIGEAKELADYAEDDTRTGYP
jgi:hypothetical protein